MSTTVELRVIVTTSDPRPEAAERIETAVRRNLTREYDPASLYVERVVPRH
jgi:hypothetical protein